MSLFCHKLIIYTVHVCVLHDTKVIFNILGRFSILRGNTNNILLVREGNDTLITLGKQYIQFRRNNHRLVNILYENTRVISPLILIL